MKLILSITAFLALSSCSISMMQVNAPIDDQEEVEEDVTYPKMPKFPKL